LNPAVSQGVASNCADKFLLIAGVAKSNFLSLQLFLIFFRVTDLIYMFRLWFSIVLLFIVLFSLSLNCLGSSQSFSAVLTIYDSVGKEEGGMVKKQKRKIR
jgi:hypothetical protein